MSTSSFIAGRRQPSSSGFLAASRFRWQSGCSTSPSRRQPRRIRGMSIEAQVAGHYTRGDIERIILDGLAASGKNIERLATTDLSAADELHLGWLTATKELAKSLGLSPGMHVLDIGSGLGGPGRYFAEACGCRVTGIDLTQEFVEVANNLTRRCGLADRAVFKQASALDMPFGDATFDAATM